MKSLAIACLILTAGGCANHAPITSPTAGTYDADATKWSNAWVEVDAAAFERNIVRVRETIGPATKLCATMKADAYRHGLALLTPSLIKQGVSCIGIASNEEARIARELGYKGQILRLRSASTPEMVEGMRFDIEELIGNPTAAKLLADEAKKANKTVRIHMALNAGEMDRNGIEMRAPDGRKQAMEIIKTPNLRVVGIMTHFALEDKDKIKAQAQAFSDDANWIIASGGLRREDVTLHAANSFATIEVPEARFDMVRPGRILYGYSSYPQFERLLTFKTRVTTVNSYLVNTGVTYGHTYVLKRDSRLANIPVGYADAHRKAYTTGDVLIRGHKVPIVGAITMNTLMADVTDFPDISTNDEVVLYGAQSNGSLTGDDLQKFIKESMVEMTTRWSVNPRILRAPNGVAGL